MNNVSGNAYVKKNIDQGMTNINTSNGTIHDGNQKENG